MNKIFILFVASATMMAAACSKDDDSPTTKGDEACRVSKITHFRYNSEVSDVNFEYDEEGRVISVSEFSDYGADIYSFTYGTNRIEVNDMSDRQTSYILQNGRVRAKQVLSEDGRKVNSTYRYNDEGYLISIGSSYVDIEFEYKNGNISLLKSSYDMHNFIPKYNDLPRLPYAEQLVGAFAEWFFIDYDDAILYEQGYFGKKIKNQIISVKEKGSSGSEFNHFYTYKNNSEGKPNSISSYHMYEDAPMKELEGTFNYEFICRQ